MATRSRPAAHSRRHSIRNAIILLVILFALAALIYPTVKRCRVRRHPRVSSSLSNIKQLGIAMLMYADDYGGWLPSSSKWTQTITPYVRSAKPFRSPIDPTTQPVSYLMVERYSRASLSDIPNRAETPLLYEAEYGAPADWANGGINVLFADGHAKWMSQLPQIPN